jgi:hypothetical protein
MISGVQALKQTNKNIKEEKSVVHKIVFFPNHA